MISFSKSKAPPPVNTNLKLSGFTVLIAFATTSKYIFSANCFLTSLTSEVSLIKYPSFSQLLNILLFGTPSTNLVNSLSKLCTPVDILATFSVALLLLITITSVEYPPIFTTPRLPL